MRAPEQQQAWRSRFRESRLRLRDGGDASNEKDRSRLMFHDDNKAVVNIRACRSLDFTISQHLC